MKNKNTLIYVLVPLILVIGFFICNEIKKANLDVGDQVANSIGNHLGSDDLANGGGNSPSTLGGPIIPRGVYVASKYFTTAQGGDGAIPQYVLDNPDVDGVHFRLYWKDLEPSLNTYDWTRIDSEFARTAAAGKYISFDIGGGDKAPDWAKPAGTNYTFKEVRLNGAGQTFQVRMNLPWGGQYKQYQKDMLAALATHLKVTPAIYDKISYIRDYSGVFTDTDETRLPEQSMLQSTLDGGWSTDSPALWAAQGYKPSRIFNTWKTMTDYQFSQFPDKYLAYALISTDNAFPPIDENSQVFVPTTANPMRDLTQEMINEGFNSYPYFAIDFNALYTPGGRNPIIAAATALGHIAGYQLNQKKLADPICAFTEVPVSPCSVADQNAFQAVFDNGFLDGATFFEVFEKNVAAYPNAIHYAHNYLLPSVPTGLSVTSVGETNALLSWLPSTSITPGIVPTYEVFANDVSVGKVSGTTMDVTGLYSNFAYSFKVRAFDGALYSDKSLAVNALTLASTVLKPDLVVTNITMTPENPIAGQTVTFKGKIKNLGIVACPSTTSVINFYVDGTLVATKSYVTPLAPGVSSSLFDATGTWSATTGAHTIKAFVDGTNVIDESSEVNNDTFTKSVTVQSDTTAPVITGITSSVTTYTAIINWTTDDAATTQISYGKNSLALTPGGNYPLSSPVISSLVTPHNVTLAGLLPNRTYYYVVRSTNNVGLTTSSLEQSFTTALGPQSNPPTVSAGSDHTTIGTLTFSLTGSFTDIDGPVPYNKYWTLVSGPGTATFSNSGSNTTNVTVSAYSDTVPYVFRFTVADNYGYNGTATVSETVKQN